MRIAYVAKHHSGGNQDEEAITYALKSLGHDVHCVQERYGESIIGGDYQLLLFHKWYDRQTLRYLPRTIKVFWYFDMVGTGGDKTLTARSQERVKWMQDIIPLVDIGFCTDGDWVEGGYQAGKLVHLTQGADARITGIDDWYGHPSRREKILFSGLTRRCGVKRTLFFDRIMSKYKTRFTHVRNSYREDLRGIIASTGVVLCPDFPVTDRYWSNRVYVAAGFGGVVTHPYSAGLHEHYDNHEIMFYHSMDDLYAKIDEVTADPVKALRFREYAFARTIREHTYTHRCQTLLRVVAERFGVK